MANEKIVTVDNLETFLDNLDARYLPLTAGSTKALTGNLYFTSSQYAHYLQVTAGTDATTSTWSFVGPSGSNGVQTLLSFTGSNLTLYGGTISHGSYTYTLPSATGTLALTSDIPTSVGSLTNDRFIQYNTASQGLTSTEQSNARTNIGIPDLNNFVTTNTAQTITGNKTFSGASIEFTATNASNNLGMEWYVSGGNNFFRFYTYNSSQNKTEVARFEGSTLKTKSIRPITDGGYDLGFSSLRWYDLYLSGAIKDGTHTFSLPSATGTLALTSDINTAINNLPSPMVFKGSIGTSGTIEWSALPAASSSNTGFTYKVITAHSTAPVAAVGDTIISDGTNWIVIPSGDEPSGTVTSVAMTAGTGLTVTGSPITSSGTIDVSIASGYKLPTTTEWNAIPDAANNGVLTIQKNGTSVGTFSANQSTNETINISLSIGDIGGASYATTADINGLFN